MDSDKAGPTSAAAASHNSNESTEDSKNVDETTNSVRRRSRSRSSEKVNPGKFNISISCLSLPRHVDNNSKLDLTGIWAIGLNSGKLIGNTKIREGWMGWVQFLNYSISVSG